MLTPPNVTREELWEALKNDAPTHIRITQFNTTYTDNDIVASGIDIRDYLNADQDLVIGKSMMSEVSFEMFAETFMNSFNIGSFTLEIGVEINGTTEWIMIGTYKPVEPQKYIDAKTVTVYAYDNMSKFDVPAEDWLKSLTYPMTVRQMFESLCSYVGVTGEVGNALTNMLNRSFSEPPITNLGVMCRDVLEAIAEACGCYAKITAGGNCRLVWYARPKNGNLYYSYIVSNDEIFQRSAISMTMGIGGLNVKNTEDDVGVLYPSTATSNIYVIVDNPFLKTATSAEETNYIVPLYNRLRDSSIERNPIDVTCVGNPLVEVGDVIDVAIMDGSSNFVMPIFTKETHWDGGLTDRYQFTGRANRQSYTNNVKQKLAEGGRFHIFKNDIDQLYSEIADVAGDVTIVDQKADNIALSAGKKARMWYSNTAPTGTTSEPLVANVDYWINTSDNRKLMRWTGSAWAAADDISKYTKYSGIDINQNGVDITGSKYVKIQSGGSLLVDATNFKIDSANKLLKSGNWQFDDSGLTYKYTGNNHEFRIINGDISNYPNMKTGFRVQDYMISLYVPANGNVPKAIDFVYQPALGTQGQLDYVAAGVEIDPPSGTPGKVGNETGFWEYGFFRTLFAGKISFRGTKAISNLIRFVDNTQDAYGNGIAIGDGGLVVIGAGESAQKVLDSGGVSGGTETLFLCSDGNVYIETNVQDAWASRKEFVFGNNGNLTVPGSVSASGNVSATGNVSAQHFYKNGTELNPNTWRGFQVKQYQYTYTIAANSSLQIPASSFLGNSAPSGYTPVAISYFNTSDSNVEVFYLDATATGNAAMVILQNRANAQISHPMAIKILYLQN